MGIFLAQTENVLIRLRFDFGFNQRKLGKATPDVAKLYLRMPGVVGNGAGPKVSRVFS
jgi:hypothetical protein